MTGKIFVNYRRVQEGGWAAEAIKTRLAAEFGAERIFLDINSIPPGADFAEQIRSEIARAVALVVVLGKDWYMIQDKETGDKRIGMKGDWVREEIRTAIDRKIPIFPLPIDDAELPPEKALPPDVKPLITKHQAWPVRQAHVDDDLRPVIDELAKQTGLPLARAGSFKSDHYSSAIKDLLYARDAFHAQLFRKPNVIGTAIGRYLIRKSEPWPDARASNFLGRLLRDPRTLENSEVRPYSRPCVLVFVSQWLAEFSDPAHAIEPSLVLPDGRQVSVCVVLATFVRPQQPVLPISFMAGPVGGGFPVISRHQNVQQMATLGCLVKDETAVHALTSLRAVGHDGREAATLIEGRIHLIGRSDVRHAGITPFSAVYPGLSDTQADLELDAGLVHLDDVTAVTSQLFGVGGPGPVSERSLATTDLDILGTPVKSFACAAGAISGRIVGLFYRFRSAEGNDAICEFLIGTDADCDVERLASVSNSGAIWSVEGPNDMGPRPIACWLGGQRLGSMVATFILATSLNTVMKLLNVRIVRDLNTGLPAQWTTLRAPEGPNSDKAGKQALRARAKKGSKRGAPTSGT